MNVGRLSSAALLASGVAGAIAPMEVAKALHIVPANERGVAEVRAGVGGTYAMLGLWAMLSRSPHAQRAVGITWLGAALARVASLKLDGPETDRTYWTYLAAEVTLGTLALFTATARKT